MSLILLSRQPPHCRPLSHRHLPVVFRKNLAGDLMAAARRWAAVLVVPAIALAFLAVPVLGFPGRLTTGCATWIAIAGGLEVLSVLGFVLAFDLVFGRGLSRRRSLGAGLRAVGATAC